MESPDALKVTNEEGVSSWADESKGTAAQRDIYRETQVTLYYCMNAAEEDLEWEEAVLHSMYLKMIEQL